MKNIKYIIFIGLASVAASCHKTTIIDGLVQDAYTGKPIAGATVYTWFNLDIGHANTTGGSLHVKTDGNGRFYYENEDIIAIFGTDVTADGYGLRLYDTPKLYERECNKPIYRLIPRNGILKVRLENTSGTTDSLFFNLVNECDKSNYAVYWQTSDPYPLLQEKDERHFAYFKMCRGKPTYLSWRFERNDFSSIQKDTLEIGMEDTTNYTLKY